MSVMANISFTSITKPQACSFSNPNSEQLNSIHSSSSSSFSSIVHFTDVFGRTSRMCLQFKRRQAARPDVVMAAAKPEPLKVMISGAPASGKGTQCELITKKYQLVHIAAGDLLRAEVAVGSKNGKLAKEFMEKGKLVPNEIVVMMVKERLLQDDAQENGWLLDGYPRSLSQAKALEDLNIHPDLFILLDVSEDILVERVVGRRLDPVTGKIYHLKYSPPENEEIAARLIQRFDDTEEKVKLRLQTHNQNVDAVLAIYKDVIYKVCGQVILAFANQLMFWKKEEDVGRNVGQVQRVNTLFLYRLKFKINNRISKLRYRCYCYLENLTRPEGIDDKDDMKDV